jgi:7-carboxy-7-deazaguanine synthase
MSVDEVFERVERLGCGLVELTGGEPLLQKDIGELATRLCDAGYTVLLETGGHRDVSVMDPRVILIVDIKCPDSGESERNLWSNIERLRPTDEVKFVLASARDYEWARDVITRYRLSERTSVLLSTAYGLLQPATVVEWLLRDRLDVRFQLQMHKFIWSAAARGV